MTYPPQRQPPVTPGYSPGPPHDAKRSVLPWIIAVLAVLVAGGALAFVLTRGDGSEAIPSAATSPQVSTARVEAADSYASALALVGALNEAGIACENWERTDNPIQAVDLGSCYVGSEEVVVAIHASRQEAGEEAPSKHRLLQGVSDVDVVVGGDWTLSCDSADLCGRIERDFGGIYQHIPA